jgi:hypothetical protein
VGEYYEKQLRDQVAGLRQELAEAQQRMAAVRALHYPEGSMWDGLQCYLCGGPNYPCETVEALDGVAPEDSVNRTA